MKTTTTKANKEMAQRLLTLRQDLLALKKEERELTNYFKDLIADDKCLTVSTAIVISKHETTRNTYNSKMLDTFFNDNGLDNNEYKKQSQVISLKLASL